MDYTDNKNYEDFYKKIYQNGNFTIYDAGEVEVFNNKDDEGDEDEIKTKMVKSYFGIDKWGRIFHDTNKSKLIKRIRDYHKKVLAHKSTLERI